MDLSDPVGDVLRQWRNARRMKAPGCHHDFASGELTSIGCDPESSVTGWRQTLNCRSERYGCSHDLSISGDSCCDLSAAHEPVRICAVVCPSRKRRGPVRGDKSELFPAVLPCSAKAVTALDDQVLATRFSQETRHGEPDVTRPYDQNIDGLRQRHIDLLSRDFLPALPPHFQDNASARHLSYQLYVPNPEFADV